MATNASCRCAPSGWQFTPCKKKIFVASSHVSQVYSASYDQATKTVSALTADFFLAAYAEVLIIIGYCHLCVGSSNACE
jgi:hypothetical protein